MKRYRIEKSKLHGETGIPPSKSQSLRAILFGAFGKGKSTIYDPLPSPDTHAMIEACRILGAKVDIVGNSLEIQGLDGVVKYAQNVIDAGNSGLVLRFCAAVGALASHPVVITGDASIRSQRPMKSLLSGLQQLGVSALSMRGDGYAPVIIQGPFKAGSARICGADSQPVSALLIAAAFSPGPVELSVSDPGEKPWVGLTLHWFDRLGIPYQNHNFETYRLPGQARYEGFEYTVPGDFSSAAFPIAAALITRSAITIRNVDWLDPQGDKRLIDVFKSMGAHIEIDEESHTLRVMKGEGLVGVKVDINDFIDSITILAVVACFAEGETHIYNAAIAKQKECNRIHCIAAELRKMGADITETEDGLIIKKSVLHGADLNSYHDHRMALSLAVAAMGAQGASSIGPVECVDKTFSTFVRDFKVLGANIEVLV